jgi:hypothetical protein
VRVPDPSGTRRQAGKLGLVRLMSKLRNTSFVLVAIPLLSGLGTIEGCASKLGPRDGTCEEATANTELNCEVDARDAAIDDLPNYPKLVGYLCNGSVRPDDSATMIEGIPKGRICSDRGLIGQAGLRGYCCTANETQCAYNPQADCLSPRNGFECYGSMRPEMYNASIYCDQAVRSDSLVNYCCADVRVPWGCRTSNGCGKDLSSWNCDPDIVPRSQELLVSKSRADTYLMTCSIPKANSDNTFNYCCYVPSVIPDGGTCLQDTKVPGCAAGKFGFACTGPENPELDFPIMSCPNPGIPGTSAEGYSATLYCCDFKG